MIATYLTIMWYHIDFGPNQYHCESDMYLLSCIALEFTIIIDRAVGAPGNGKNVVDGLNARYKQMHKLAMTKVLNPKLI